jgi:hypothetical protein
MQRHATHSKMLLMQQHPWRVQDAAAGAAPAADADTVLVITAAAISAAVTPTKLWATAAPAAAAAGIITCLLTASLLIYLNCVMLPCNCSNFLQPWLLLLLLLLLLFKCLPCEHPQRFTAGYH